MISLLIGDSTAVSWYRSGELQVIGHFINPVEACVHALSRLDAMRAEFAVDQVMIANGRAIIASIDL